MSRYSNFTPEDGTEFLCPLCGAVLTEKERTAAEGGWNCKCGEFIPKSLAVDPYKGLSNKHRKNNNWR